MNKFSHGQLKIVKGTASEPKASDNRVILNIVDTSGEWYTALSNKLSSKWPKIKDNYRGWFRGQSQFKIGNIQSIQIQSDTMVINCLAINDGVLELSALEKCFLAVGREVELNKSNIHMDKIDAEWDKIQELITKYILSKGLSVTVYNDE